MLEVGSIGLWAGRDLINVLREYFDSISDILTRITPASFGGILKIIGTSSLNTLDWSLINNGITF